MQEPIRITRREMLKCILATPLSAVLAGLPSSRAHAQLDECLNPLRKGGPSGPYAPILPHFEPKLQVPIPNPPDS